MMSAVIPSSSDARQTPVRPDPHITSSQITSGGYTPSNTVGGTSATLLQLLDIPLLRDADDGPGYYVAAKGAAAGWPGAAVQSSLNNTDFDQVAEVGELAIFGACTTTLGNYTGVGFDPVQEPSVKAAFGLKSGGGPRPEVILRPIP